MYSICMYTMPSHRLCLLGIIIILCLLQLGASSSSSSIVSRKKAASSTTQHLQFHKPPAPRHQASGVEKTSYSQYERFGSPSGHLSTIRGGIINAKVNKHNPLTSRQVLLFVPNIIGYIRIAVRNYFSKWWSL